MPLVGAAAHISAIGNDYPRDAAGADGIGLGNVQE